MPSPPSTTSDAPLGTFEEQVLLAVWRTGRAPDGSGAYGMAGREMRDRLWRGVDLVPLLAGGNARGGT